MNSPFRNVRLINYSYSMTLVSTLITAIAPLIATLVDGLFAGQMLGTASFNAVSVSMPVVNAIGVLTMICNMGGSVLAANQLARGNTRKANQIFTIALVSSVAVALTAVIILFLFMDSIALGLSDDPASAAYVKDYLQVMLLYFLAVPFCTTLNNFIAVSGHPKLTTQAVVAANIVNILLDVVFIGLLHWGIRGAALATVICGLVNITVLLPFVLSRRSSLKLVRLSAEKWSILKENLRQGIGFNVFYIVTNAFMIACNDLIAGQLGAESITLFGICLQIQSLTFAVTIGICLAGIPLVGYLRSDDDYEGVLYILNRSLLNVIVFYALLALLMSFFPSLFLTAFGLSDPSWRAMARVPFVCYSIYYFCFCLLAVYTTLSLQLSGRVGAKIFFIFGVSGLSYLCMRLFSFVSPDAIWYGLVVGSIPVPIAAMSYGYWLHRRNPLLSRFTVSSTLPECVKIEFSLEYESNDTSKVDNAVDTFAKICEMTEDEHRKIKTTLDKLCAIAVSNRRQNVKFYDFTLKETEYDYELIVKDAGTPFNLITDCDEELLKELDYQYVFGLNVTKVKWQKSACLNVQA